MQMLRSLLFNIWMYIWMAVIGIGLAPWAILSPRGARAGCDTYARHVLKMLPILIGLKVEVRGTPPTGDVLIAAKHQSFLDIFMIWDAVPRGLFIMKAILMYSPFLGQYAKRLGCIPVHRGKRAEAIKKMLSDVKSGEHEGGQLIIYPQGTRVAPGASRPYKVGTFALYEQLGQPCIPVAANVGVFWPKRGLLRHPGNAVVEFMEPIPPGLDRATFMAVLEARIEGGSNRLMAEAGFPADQLPDVIAEPAIPAA